MPPPNCKLVVILTGSSVLNDAIGAITGAVPYLVAIFGTLAVVGWIVSSKSSKHRGKFFTWGMYLIWGVFLFSVLAMVITWLVPNSCVTPPSTPPAATSTPAG